nr:MAG TPA: hypothetical protein [Caudoviricetes sp.]
MYQREWRASGAGDGATDRALLGTLLYHTPRIHTDSWKNSPVWVRGLYGSEAPS